MLKNNWVWITLALIAAVSTSGCSKQSRKERHLTRADGYFRSKDFKKSEIEYLNALGLDPTNTWVMTRLATIYYDRGDGFRALPFLVSAIEANKDNVDARLKLATIYLSGRQLQKAREQALYILSRDAKNDDALLLLADAAVTPQDLVDARQRLQNLQSQAANKAAWHLAMAGLNLRQTNMPAAEDAFKQALALEPQSSRVHLALAGYHWQKKEIVQAEESFQKSVELAPANPNTRLRWAAFRFNTGSTNGAKELLHQITQQTPDYAPAWIYRARIAFEEREYHECSNIVHRVLLQDVVNYDARLLRAGLKRVQGKPREAIKEFEELKRLYPRSSEVAFHLALTRLQVQDRGGAINSLQEALALDPNSTQAILLLAELNLQKGDAASATSALENLIRKQPGIHRAYFLLASAYSAQNRFDEALTLYTGLGKSFPTNAVIPFFTGLTLRQGKRDAEARRAFEKAAELAPHDLLIGYQLVELDLMDRNYQRAFERVRRILETNPKSAGAKFLEARIHLTQTNLTAAEAALQKTIEWDANMAPAYGLLAKIYLESGKLPQALQNLEQMVTRNPRDVSTRTLLGSVYDKTGNAQKAVEQYKEALKIAPHFVPALNNLAYVLSDKLNKLDEAYEYGAKARDLVPESHHVADTFGWILYRRGDYSRALLLLQESATRAPDQAEIQFHLGMAAYAMAQEVTARAALRRALELEPNLPARAEALDRLSVLDMDASRGDQGALAKLRERIQKQPDDAVALLRLGRLYAAMGNTAQAIPTFENARKLSPASVPVLVELIELYSKDPKQSKQAVTLAREARKLSPADPAIAHVLGRLVYQAGDHAWACSLLQESAARKSGDPDLLFDLAQAYYSLGRIEEAEETARRALLAGAASDREKEVQWFLTLIRLYKNPAEQLQAQTRVQQSLKANPDYLPALVVAAMIHEQQTRTNEAKQVYEQILARNPEFAPARKHLAALYTDYFGDQQKAMDHATKAREVLPADPLLAKTLGKISYRRGDYQNALRFLKESHARRSDDPDLLCFLGMAHYQLKHPTESKEALTRALALDPNGSAAPEARKLLAKLQE
jgi:tetratricopeptide (TPR) repeat protein